jgi:hypothetical protein
MGFCFPNNDSRSTLGIPQSSADSPFLSKTFNAIAKKATQKQKRRDDWQGDLQSGFLKKNGPSVWRPKQIESGLRAGLSVSRYAARVVVGDHRDDTRSHCRKKKLTLGHESSRLSGNGPNSTVREIQTPGG